VRPLSGLIGRPLARFQGLTGMLARENTRRQPQRTAVTASALMIGVALVVLVAIFAAGLRATIDKGIDEQVKAVSIVQHQDGFSPLRRRDRPAAPRRRHHHRPRRCASRPASCVRSTATSRSPGSIRPRSTR
jgi:putative ABC transport system permease protein